MGRDRESSSRSHKRKHRSGAGDDSSDDAREQRRRSRSTSPPSKSRRKPEKSRRSERDVASKSPSPVNSANKKEESLSIEETNKLRKQLGLAPLEMNDGPKAKESENGSDSKEKVVVEDGMEFVHKVPEHMGEKKRAEEVKEKLQVMREKRRIYDKVLKTKGLAESDSDEDASAWVIKNRQMEEERKRAEERAKLLDDMDAEFGVDTMIEDEKKRRAENIQKKKRQQKQKSDTAGLVVGHSKEDFLEGNETVLVLEDRDVLAEGDEVLVNPNIVDNTKYAKNAELRKKKGSYQPYPEESLDDYGVHKAKTVLSKYDEELEGEERQMFRLDESGEVDLEKERQEMLIRKNLMMANKRLESIENQKYRVASEFYTAEEMISFRRPSKKKDGKKLRKRKVRVLRADDLVPEETTQEDEKARALRLAAHKVGSLAHKVKQETTAEVDDEAKQAQTDGSKKLEDGEVNEDGSEKGIAKSDGKWQRAETSGLVDIQLLNKFVEREEKEDEESDDDDDDLVGGVDLTGVVIEDDAEDELSSVLERARKIRQAEIKKEDTEVDSAAKVHEMIEEHRIKEEPLDEESMEQERLNEESSNGVVIDSTMEYCRGLGEIPTYGLAGNRKDVVDVSELKEAEALARAQAVVAAAEDMKQEIVPERDDDEDMNVDDVINKWRQKGREKTKQLKGKWTQATTSGAALDDGSQQQSTSRSRGFSEGDLDSDDDGPYNVLGEERDVTKGMAAMVKLAAEKGYLDQGKERKVNGPSLKHLENKRFSQIEVGKYDIEEKYTKKLERMGTTGTGPVRPFPEKSDYKPDIRITYIDERGREMESKDAFRVLSWKFHGKGPGKRQIERRQAKMEKKELMKKMNSMDTPLGTLQKQLKKQESLQSPYIILSGSGRDTGAPLKKD